MCCKDHVTCLVGYNGIRMCNHMVQELFDLDHSVLGGICLLGGNGAKSSYHCAVDASCIVEERADYLPNILLVLFGEGWGRVNGLRILFGCTLHGFDVEIRLVLRLCRWRVLELDECLRYIIAHGDMDAFVDVVLVNIHSKIVCAVPVLGEFVVFIHDAREVLNSSRPTYLMPKSSMQSVKEIGQKLCCHRPGVIRGGNDKNTKNIFLPFGVFITWDP